MRSFLLVCILSLLAISSSAQGDSLFVTVRDSTWVFQHKTVPGETVFILAKRYYVPPAVLADVNSLNFQDKLLENTVVYIPVSAYNIIGKAPVSATAAQKIYRKVSAKDNIARLAKYAGVSVATFKEWNNLSTDQVTPGQLFFAGWVKYDAAQTPFSNIGSNDVNSIIIPVEKPVVDTTSAEEKLYLVQTNNELNAIEEKGAVVFFASTGKVKSSDVFFAFHATATKGTIIKVFNPGTNKTIFVKALAPLPATKQYANSILGIGSIAKDALGVTENKAWCELKYAGN